MVQIVEDFEGACALIKVLLPQNCKTNSKLVLLSDSQLPENWNRQLILYLRRNWDMLQLLEGVPLIKIQNQSGQQYLCKLSKSAPPMLNTTNKNCISDVIKTFLVSCGVNFCIDQELNDVDKYHLSSKGYVQEPSSQNILIALEERYNVLGLNQIKLMMEKSGRELKEQLMNLLTEHKAVIPAFVSKLPIFSIHKSNSFVAAEDCYLVTEEDIPDVWNSQMSQLVVKTAVVKPVAQKMKITEWSFSDVCKDIIKFLNSIDIEQQSSFFDWIMNKVSMNMSVPDSFLPAMKPYLHVQTANTGSRQKPSELFERVGLCSIAFSNEECKFPNQKYNVELLKQLGLKNDLGVISRDIESSINEIRNINQISDTILSKVEAMLKLIEKNSLHIQAGSPWIPVAVENPPNYPSNLSWFANGIFATPEELFVQGDENYVGSVCSIVHPKINDVFIQCFKQRKERNIKDVFAHLENIHQSYDDEEKGLFKTMTFKVYEYLSKNRSNVLAHKQLLHMIWQGQKFVPLNQVIVNDLKIIVEPYFFKVPSEVSSRLGDVLLDVVISDSEYNIYLNVLKMIAAKNDERESIMHYESDFKLSVNLVNHLADNELEKCLNDKENIYVPVNGATLKLFPLSECYYVDKASSRKYQASVSSNKILHSEFGKKIAKKLEVTNLINKVLGGKNSSFIKPWGQKEPLTLRLKRLLDEYQDGLAIIKELIQNADDAGASTVKLLYDKRQNNDMKDLLFDPGMRDWQGPALWVFNDQVFTESDFENITKLNAGTKEFDTKKIGKFGLGFNSVYHLTDVPSFLSNDSLVVFDPHADYLGEVLESKDVPGIRINLSENFQDFSNFRHQFEVYNGIFDANFDFGEDGKFDAYNGTLFRLPLRQQEMAGKSEIKQLEYSDNEVQRLLSKLKDALSDLILFTTNVTNLEVFEMKGSVMETKSLFKVSKTLLQKSNNISSSIIDMANEELKRTEKNCNYQPKRGNVVSEIEMKVWHSSQLISTQPWLTVSSVGSKDSFEYAIKNKGHLPCGGVSIPLIDTCSSQEVFPGRLFCFLPLPIKSSFPFHVNAAFSISRNRQSLQALSTDDKNYGEVFNWNHLLGSDLGQSYMELLFQIGKKLVIPPPSEDWVNFLFPSIGEIHEKFAENMVRGMLNRLVDNRNESPILPAAKCWLPWKKVKTLDKKLSQSKDLADKCKAFLNWIYSLENQTMECIIFPERFHDLLTQFDFQNSLNEIIVQEHEVYKLFLNNIGNGELDPELSLIIF